MEAKKRNVNLFMAIVAALLFGGFLGYMAAPREVIRIENPVEVAPDLLPEDEALEKIRETIAGNTTLIYGAIGASLIAALAAIVSLMQISQHIR